MTTICLKTNNTQILDFIFEQLHAFEKETTKISKKQFKIYNNVTIHYKGNNLEQFYNKISTILSKAIIEFYELTILKRLINTDYFYFCEEDKKIIIDEYYLLKKSLDKKVLKNTINQLITKPIEEYIKKHKIMIIDGFVNFRLQTYFLYLEEQLVESVNQFVIDQEYIKYVNLLRDYVSTKIPENTTVHLIYFNSDGLLLSENGEILQLDGFSSTFLSDVTFSQNDYILNTLVGMLPYKINIHLISKEDQFIKTIKLIFENKVHTCNGCELCKVYKMLQKNFLNY